MRAWEIRSPDGVDALHLARRARPAPGPGEVLVRVQASSVNYRDLATIEDPVSRGLPYPRVPNSDAAGEVLEVGEGVTRWVPGDRVTSTFFRDWVDGDIDATAMASALGGALDGVLAESFVAPEHALVQVPAHLDAVQASTLPCAALTAWHALFEIGTLRPGDTVALLGTGGVSVFALQLCAAFGVDTIVTSSSEAKLERARALGATHTINYRETPDWERPMLELTHGRGVDRVVEVGGAGTLGRSASAVRVGGVIALIGVLTGGTVNPTPLMRKSVRLQGVYVGSRAMFERMNRAIERARLAPVVDQVYDFESAPSAYHRMRAAGHFGKLVIRV